MAHTLPTAFQSDLGGYLGAFFAFSSSGFVLVRLGRGRRGLAGNESGRWTVVTMGMDGVAERRRSSLPFQQFITLHVHAFLSSRYHAYVAEKAGLGMCVGCQRTVVVALLPWHRTYL